MDRLPIVDDAHALSWPGENAPRMNSPQDFSPHEPPVTHRFSHDAAPEFVPPGDGHFFDDRADAVIMPPPGDYVFDDPTLGPTIRIFEPKARVYFDTGWEAPDKLDIFHDGSLAPSINFLELFWAKQWPEGLGQPDWRWGPNIGVGISSRAGDSSDGSTLASGAPVLMMSYGLVFEFPLTSAQTEVLRADAASNPAILGQLRRLTPKAGVEVGYALGISADESLDYSADGAIYVGVTLHVLP